MVLRAGAGKHCPCDVFILLVLANDAVKRRNYGHVLYPRCSTGAGDGCDLFGIRRSITMMMGRGHDIHVIDAERSPSKYQTDVTTGADQAGHSRPECF